MTATLDTPVVNLDEVHDIADVVVPAPRADERTRDQRLFDEARAFISRFWIAPSEAALDAVVLWAAHTNAVEPDNTLVFESTPRLFFASVGPASGKTTALHMTELLSGRAERITDPSAPAMLGLIEMEKATLLVDELDTMLGSSAGGKSTRAIMLDGAYRAGTVVRGAPSNPSGVRRVSVFAPMAMAGMRQQFMANPRLEALRTRTIVINCRPRTSSQVVENFRRRIHAPQAAALKNALAQWGKANSAALGDCWPTMPDGVEDRLEDVWGPILAVGEVIGGEWAERARNACRILALNEPEESDEPTSPLEMLLRDLAIVFEGAERLASRTIVARLQALPGSAWRRYPSPQAAGREMAAILAPLGIAPKPVWLDGMTVRGYAWADLAPHCPDIPQTATDDEVDADELPW